MTTIIYRLVCLMLLFLSVSLQAESFRCEAEQLAGFVYNPAKKDWQAGGSVTQSSFTVLRQSEAGVKNIGPVWFVKELGKDFGMACAADFDDQGFLYCEGLGGDFMMNKNTLRFRYLLDKGYVVDRYTEIAPEGKYGPHMKIGACKPD